MEPCGNSIICQIILDKKLTDLKNLGYKYHQADIQEFIGLLKNGFYKLLPLKDFHGNRIAYLESMTQVHLSAAYCSADAAEQYEALWNQGHGGKHLQALRNYCWFSIALAPTPVQSHWHRGV